MISTIMMGMRMTVIKIKVMRMKRTTLITLRAPAHQSFLLFVIIVMMILIMTGPTVDPIRSTENPSKPVRDPIGPLGTLLDQLEKQLRTVWFTLVSHICRTV